MPSFKTVADFFIDYWTQIVVFLGFIVASISYLVQRIYKNRDDKSFKLFEIFQEKKLESVMNLFTAINKQNEKMLIAVSVRNIQELISETNELDELHKEVYLQFCYSANFFVNHDFVNFQNYYIALSNHYGDIQRYASESLTKGEIDTDLQRSIREKTQSAINDGSFNAIKSQLIRYYIGK